MLSSIKFRPKAEEVLKEGVERQVKYVAVEKKESGATSSQHFQLEELVDDLGGMMLYTSGTTSRPVFASCSAIETVLTIDCSQKGVFLPQSVLTAQSQSLLRAWNYTAQDHILHVLPLHHIHGTVNALLTPLFAGSTIEFLFPFNVNAVWERLAAPFLPQDEIQRRRKPPITFLTAVPTIYNRLIASHQALKSPIFDASKRALSPEILRLNMSGSAALPTPTKKAWSELSNGNVLLERYGMTEVGMALSCGLDFHDRVDGSVGWPLPSVEARLVDSETNEVIKEGEEDADGKEREGEIQLRGPTVFKEYWRNPKATADEFVEGEDGKGRWFKTGDVATRRAVKGAGQSGQDWAKGPMYFIRGRRSVDIIKSGGEKISALEIERELLSLYESPVCAWLGMLTSRRPQISEAAVVGVSSEQWGQKVAAVVVLHSEHAQSGRGGKTWGVMDMRRALKDKLANYKIPQELKVVDAIPKNAMGKSQCSTTSLTLISHANSS